MLFGRDAWERVRGRIQEAGLAVQPLLLEPDGSLADGDFQAAWFSPELFALKQDEAFLAAVLGCPTVRWMQSGRSGFDHPAFAQLARRGVRLSRSTAPAPAIAEYVIASVFDRFQRGPERRLAQQAQEWRPLPFKEIAGSRWLCVGFGEIGREVGRRARALGAHVTGVRRSGGDSDCADLVVTPDRMGGALAAADVVVLSVPLTPDNDGSYGRDFFAGFRAGALFVNVGRGQLLDEPALRAALDSGRVGHCVLDVTRVEPLPRGEWQWTHPQVTLTAHTSGIGSGLIGRTDALLIENLGRYLSGGPLLHELNPENFA